MDRIPRVAFFTDSFHEVNGVALTSREFARFAENQSFPFFSVHAGPATRHWKVGSFEHYELAASRALIPLEHDLTFDLLGFRHLGGLAEALREFQPDLVHVTGPGHAGMLGARLAYKLGVPLAASWHTNVHEFGATRLRRLMRNWPGGLQRSLTGFAERRSLDLAIRFYKLAQLLFAPNPELCAMLERRCGRPVFPMYRGIDCQLYHPERRQAHEGKFVIGYVGRVSPEKNVRMLAAVEEELRRRGLQEYEIQVAGDGSERLWLEANLKQAVFLGVLKGQALAEAYARMDALLFASETDTFGNVVLEAAASGVPALVSGSGGPKFLVEDGVTGFVADGAERFANAILRLASTPGLRERMGRAARQAALSRSWNAVFEQIYRHYGKLLADAGQNIAGSNCFIEHSPSGHRG